MLLLWAVSSHGRSKKTAILRTGRISVNFWDSKLALRSLNPKNLLRVVGVYGVWLRGHIWFT